MKTFSIPTAFDKPLIVDPYHAAGVERGKAAVRRLQELGIIDSQGNRIRTDLPADMQEGSDRDEGG